MKDATIAFIGGGNMARSLIGGLTAAGVAAHAIRVADPDESSRQALVQHFGEQTFSDNNEAARGADVVVFAVKPQVLKDVARDLADTVQAERPLVVSIAAGVREPDLCRWVGGDAAVVRSMPNTPALV